MSNTRKAQIGKTKITRMNTGDAQKKHFGFAWGVYFWKLPNGHLFKDDDGNMLSIDSVEGDLGKMAEIRKAAAYYGQPEGEPWFYAGIKKVTDEQYEEQKARLAEGLIPSMDDIGAIAAAKKSLELYGGDVDG
jgi:hypothetical protein